jgi:hypothetical protein
LLYYVIKQETKESIWAAITSKKSIADWIFRRKKVRKKFEFLKFSSKKFVGLVDDEREYGQSDRKVRQRSRQRTRRRWTRRTWRSSKFCLFFEMLVWEGKTLETSCYILYRSLSCLQSFQLLFNILVIKKNLSVI